MRSGMTSLWWTKGSFTGLSLSHSSPIALAGQATGGSAWLSLLNAARTPPPRNYCGCACGWCRKVTGNDQT